MKLLRLESGGLAERMPVWGLMCFDLGFVCNHRFAATLEWSAESVLSVDSKTRLCPEVDSRNRCVESL